ncbi:MAG: 30S ribosome-binding factor RbfA [Phycisphaerales bacterium]
MSTNLPEPIPFPGEAPRDPAGRGSATAHPSYKRDQLASSLWRALQDVITRGLNDPRVTGIITVTACDVAPDYSKADIRISVLPEKYETRVLAGLRHAAVHLRREIMGKIHVRAIPELVFEVDKAAKRQAAVMEALGKVVAEREAKARDASEPLGGGNAG